MLNMQEQQRLGKFKFLQLLLDYEHYLPLNRPLVKSKYKVPTLEVAELIQHTRYA